MTEESTVVLACPVGPTINLDSKYYKLVDQMESLTEAPPSLIEAVSLTVKGPVKFVADTVIKGDVLVKNGTASSFIVQHMTDSVHVECLMTGGGRC